MIAQAPDNLLTFGSDIKLRNSLFIRESYQHPAKLHLGLLAWIVERYTEPGDTIGDCMAGVGSLLLAATIQRNVILREVEPKWLDLCQRNAEHIRRTNLFVSSIDIAQGDALVPWNFRAKHLIFSPPYGCQVTRGGARKGILSPKTRQLVAEGKLGGDWVRLATATDNGQGASYLFWYGEAAAQMGHFTGARYWAAMESVYRQAYGALDGGYMVLVLKDHIRDRRRVHTANETVTLCERLGFRLVERHERKVYPLSLWIRLAKERGELVVETEDVLVFMKQEATA